MGKRTFNWQIWAGAILSIFAFFSYPTIFVEWAFTRDFPWANLLLFVIAGALLFFGVGRSFSGGKGWLSRAGSLALAFLGLGTLCLFIVTFFVAGTSLPASGDAPEVGHRAPDFTLVDAQGNAVSLDDLRTRPMESRDGPVVPRGVLLIFYRGYW
jgi:hypothetical protein